MKKSSQANFHSLPGSKANERLSTQEDLLAGISYLPKNRIERIHKDRNPSPKSVKRKINTFIEEKVLNSPEKTAIVFEGLASNTSKIHRHQLHSNMTNLEGHEVRLRGQTAGVGIRLNSKLANVRGGLASQSIMNRRAYDQREFDERADSGERGLPDRTTAASNNLLNKSGFTYYPGAPLKVSTKSVLGQTLNKFELGEQSSHKITQISGVEYYRQHIHGNQQRRLKKYIKDAAGHAPKSKRYIPLSDVAKPSLQGRVKMYMDRLNEEELREKQRQQRTAAGQDHTTMPSIQESHYKSGALTGQSEAGSPRQTESNYMSKRANYMKPNQLEPIVTNQRQKSLNPVHRQDAYARGRQSNQDRRQMSSSLAAVSKRARIRKPDEAQTMSVSQHGSAPAMREKLAKTLGIGKQGGAQIIDEEDEFNRQLEEQANAMQTPPKLNQRNSQKRKDSDNKLVLNIGKNSNKAISKKPNDQTTKNQTQARTKDAFKKYHTIDPVHSLSDEGPLGFFYKKLLAHKLFEHTENQLPNTPAPLKKSVTETYWAIYNAGQAPSERVDTTNEKEGREPKKLYNFKVNKKAVLNYLKKRYATRLAQKLASIFDWSNGQLEYDAFYQRLDQILINPKRKDLIPREEEGKSQPQEHIEKLKQFAFQMFDMNCDKHICEADVFSFLEQHNKDDLFRDALIYDIQDITRTFKHMNRNKTHDDKVFDHRNPTAPKIKNLQLYLEQTRRKADQRREIQDEDVYLQIMSQTPSIQEGNSNGEPSIDPADMYSQFGPAYKQVYFKMSGAANKESNVVVVNKETDTNKHKDGVFDLCFKEMKSQGAQQFMAEQKKKPQLSYLIHKTNEKYKAQTFRAFLNQEDFMNDIEFKFGLPLIVLDFIDYMTGSDFISTVQSFVTPQNWVDRFDVKQRDELTEAKVQIDDDFLPYIFQIFNALGEIDLNDLGKQATPEEKESKQFLTLRSMKANLPAIFGVKNDFFAEMLFAYISNHAPETHRINFHQFLTRLYAFWPKKEQIPSGETQYDREDRERKKRQDRKREMRKFVYEFIRVSGGSMITILDLIKLSCYFQEDSCSFGAECETLMREYKRINIEPKYVHQRVEFGEQQYNKYVPYSVLIADMEHAFVGQVLNKIRQIDTMSEENNKRSEETFVTMFPQNNWKMQSVFDERLVDSNYEQELRKRTGKAAEIEVEDRLRNNRKVNEKEIERGFDIIRTWDLKQYLNQD